MYPLQLFFFLNHIQQAEWRSKFTTTKDFGWMCGSPGKANEPRGGGPGAEHLHPAISAWNQCRASSRGLRPVQGLPHEVRESHGPWGPGGVHSIFLRCWQFICECKCIYIYMYINVCKYIYIYGCTHNMVSSNWDRPCLLHISYSQGPFFWDGIHVY